MMTEAPWGVQRALLAVCLCEKPVEIKGRIGHREFAVFGGWPIGRIPVAVDLYAVAVRIIEVNSFAHAVVRSTCQVHSCLHDIGESAAKRRAIRI